MRIGFNPYKKISAFKTLNWIHYGFKNKELLKLAT